jgi:hypothetical protein
VRLVARLFERGEFAFHATHAVAHLVEGALGVALLRLDHRPFSVAASTSARRCSSVCSAARSRALSASICGLLVVVGLLIVGEEPRRFAQVDLALDDAVGRLLVEAAKDEAAAVHEVALAGGDGEKSKAGLAFQKSRKALRSSAM